MSGQGTGVVRVEVHHHWPAGVSQAARAQIESAGDLGTLRALRAMAAQMGIPLELAT